MKDNSEKKLSDITSPSNQSKKPVDLDNHHPIPRLFIFQVKLFVDAVRDILLSPVSIVATIVDIATNKKGKKQLF